MLACVAYEDAPPLTGVTENDASAGSGGGSAGSMLTPTASGSSGKLPTGGSGGTAPSPSGVSGSGSGVSGAGTGGTGGGNGGSSMADGGEAGAADAPQICTPCAELKSALVHRYDFEGGGSTVMDRVGGAHGSVKGGGTLSQVEGKGVGVLGGGTSGPYVDLPNGLLSALTSATLESWVTWSGGAGWQRIFDFGDTTSAMPEDNPANGKSYLFLTPTTDVASGGSLRLVYSLEGGAATAETRLESASSLPESLKQVVVVVVDTSAGKLLLYVDGTSVGEVAFSGTLAAINDVNAWLGRSQYSADPELTGTFHDFRVYDAALTPQQIAASFAAGTDPAFLAQ